MSPVMDELGEEETPFLLELFLLGIRKTVGFLRNRLEKQFFKKCYTSLISELKSLNEKVEETPHLNFISLIHSYKIMIDFVDGNVGYFFRNRNKLWFKHFFHDDELYNLVRKDIEKLYPNYSKVKLTITKHGTMIYDNYKKNKFNILLLTVHSGTWVPEYARKLMALSNEERFREEDIASDSIYAPIVLDKGGIWIDTKQSRFACDYNRARAGAVYENGAEKRTPIIWLGKLKKREKEHILRSYDRFYYILGKLINTHRFNIIFDGHSMGNHSTRPMFSFGIKYVPQFYIPIVAKMRETLQSITKKEVKINTPYGGGYILNYLSQKFPDVFIFSMEINKALYMNKEHTKVYNKRISRLSINIEKMFNFGHKMLK